MTTTRRFRPEPFHISTAPSPRREARRRDYARLWLASYLAGTFTEEALLMRTGEDTLAQALAWLYQAGDITRGEDR